MVNWNFFQTHEPSFKLKHFNNMWSFCWIFLRIRNQIFGLLCSWQRIILISDGDLFKQFDARKGQESNDWKSEKFEGLFQITNQYFCLIFLKFFRAKVKNIDLSKTDIAVFETFWIWFLGSCWSRNFEIEKISMSFTIWKISLVRSVFGGLKTFFYFNWIILK